MSMGVPRNFDNGTIFLLQYSREQTVASFCKLIKFPKCFRLHLKKKMFTHFGRSNILCLCKRHYVRLVEVGRLNTQKLMNQKYDTGQLFFHQIFGCRGVILFPCEVGNVLKGKPHLYYQTLIDERDYPFIRSQREPVTCLGNQDASHGLYTIRGLDYVAQEDILPYTATEKKPLQHKFFDKFLKYNRNKDPPFSAQGTFRSWQKKNHPWLELLDVHKETTENVRVTVMSFFVGYRESQALYWWRYCILLENVGEQSVQLRERHWRIFSSSGTLETIRGRGVVGQEPILSKKSTAFQYSSYVSLETPIGHMWGTFQMEREDGHLFDCRIPEISLEGKSYYGKATCGTV
eukprot:XP_016665162.1 PREDICTED: polymerase delta-interacting protein 2-like isoform X2 [Acyrthosiphon pisum]